MPPKNDDAATAPALPTIVKVTAWQSGFKVDGDRYVYDAGDLVTDPDLIASFIDRGVSFEVIEG